MLGHVMVKVLNHLSSKNLSYCINMAGTSYITQLTQTYKDHRVRTLRMYTRNKF